MINVAKLLPSTAQRPIEVLELEYPTSLTIEAAPTVPKGTSFPISGKLTFREGGVDYGLPGKIIPLSYNTESLGTVTTGTGGTYSKFVIIDEVGIFTLTAKFAGETGFSASEAKRGLSVSVPTPLTAIVSIVLPIAVGFGVVAISGRK